MALHLDVVSEVFQRHFSVISAIHWQLLYECAYVYTSTEFFYDFWLTTWKPEAVMIVGKFTMMSHGWDQGKEKTQDWEDRSKLSHHQVWRSASGVDSVTWRRLSPYRWTITKSKSFICRLIWCANGFQVWFHERVRNKFYLLSLFLGAVWRKSLNWSCGI